MDNSTTSASDASGSGSGSGTGPAPNPAPAAALSTTDRILSATDHVTTAVNAITAAGATVAEALEAAQLQDGQAAPTDPLQTQIHAIRTRMDAMEQLVGTVTAVTAIAAPGAKPVLDRVSALETAIEGVAAFAERSAPLMSRVLAAFNVHFGGKL